MRTLIVAVTCLLFVAASASATTVFQDDFESYTGWTANNGNGWFNATNEPNYTPNGWLPLYTHGAERDPGMVVASGGPHNSSPSGYGDTQGFTQWDGGTPHGQTHLLYADGSAAPAGSIVTISAKINSSGTKYSYLHLGSDGLTSAGVGEDVAGAIVNPTGKLAAATGLGSEPSTPVDWSQGWKEVSLTTHIDDAGIVEEVVASWRNIGDASWTSATKGGGSNIGAVTRFGFNVGMGATIDDLSVSVVPEPATLSMLVMSLLGLALTGLRRKNG